MSRTVRLTLRSVLFLAAVAAGAEIAHAQNVGTIDPGISKSGTPILAKVTCYAPGAGGNIQGPFATSKPSLSGQRIPFTLDDVRLGKSQYVTLAAHPQHYGKWFNMGTITYVSVIDNRQYTLNNVVGYVHDTGCAFDGSCCRRYNTCGVMHRKFDIAYGDFRGGRSSSLVYKTPVCMNKDIQWTQIGGRVDLPQTTVTPGQQVGPPVPTTIGSPTTFGRPSSPLANVNPLSRSNFGSAPGYSSSPFSSAFSPVSNTAPSYGSPSIPSPAFSPTAAPSPAPSPAAVDIVGTSVQGLKDAAVYLDAQRSVPSAAIILAQPSRARTGGAMTVSWSTLGMSACEVRSEDSLISAARDGSKVIPVTASTRRGTHTFALRCTALGGQVTEKTASLIVD